MIASRLVLAGWMLASSLAVAQQTTDPANAAPAAAGTSAGPAAPAAPMPGDKPARNAQSEAGEPRAGSGAAPATPPAARTARAPGAPAPKASDRLELDTTTVTGNRELPKVMYVVPWKKSDIGDLVGRPMNSLLDEVLAPVDRDVFRREVRYYDAVKAAGGQNGAPTGPAAAAPAPQVEK